MGARTKVATNVYWVFTVCCVEHSTLIMGCRTTHNCFSKQGPPPSFSREGNLASDLVKSFFLVAEQVHKARFTGIKFCPGEVTTGFFHGSECHLGPCWLWVNQIVLPTCQRYLDRSFVVYLIIAGIIGMWHYISLCSSGIQIRNSYTLGKGFIYQMSYNFSSIFMCICLWCYIVALLTPENSANIS